MVSAWATGSESMAVSLGGASQFELSVGRRWKADPFVARFASKSCD